jgi:hypothetical protein
MLLNNGVSSMAAFTGKDRAAALAVETSALPAGSKRIGQLCASECERNKLAALTTGFAITMIAWVVGLSLLSREWLDSLTSLSSWVFCAASVALWGVAGSLTYLGLRASAQKKAAPIQ